MSLLPNSDWSNRVLDRTATEFSRLTHLIYEAALQPALWCSAVEQVAMSVGANRGLLFSPYLAPQDGGLLFPWNLSEADLQLWATRYIEHDVWSAAALARNEAFEGVVLADEDLVPRDVLEQSLYYREYLTHVGIGRLCACGIFSPAPGMQATVLSVYRPIEGPPFSPADQEWLRLLVPHLACALGVMHRLQTAELQAATLLSALDRLTFGVVLLNAQRKVKHMKPAARIAVERGDGLLLNGVGQLDTLTTATQPLGLCDWINGINMDQEHAAHFSEAYFVLRSGAKQGRYSVQCSPLATSDAWGIDGESSRYVVFITDPEALVLPETKRLKAIYGFSEAQARVACMLAGGGSYKSTARDLFISEDTVRTHVKEIYLKARVNRLPDLVRAVLALGQVMV